MPSERILVVDDDPVAGLICRRCLEKRGYEVRVATDGQAGLEEFATWKPDGIVLDLMLPQKKGTEVIEILRGSEILNGLGARVPIFVVTNALFPQMVDEAVALGATKVFGKGDLTPDTLANAFGAELKSK